MSDVTVAPPSSAPAAAPAAPSAPARSEVPINPSPTHSPNPVPSQGVSNEHAGEGSKHRTPSRAEALKAAYDRATSTQPKEKPAPRPAPKAAEAKVGHNQPPEPTEKLDLKKRPSDIPRSERGTFAPRQASVAQQPENGSPNNAQPGVAQQPQNGQPNNAQTPYRKLAPHEPFAEPPGRVSERAKRDWATTPESIRGDVHRMHDEFAKAYKYYKDDAEIGKPVRQYAQMAREHGTTLEKALHNYVSMESRLREDPIAGLDTIVSNLGLTTPEGQPIGLRDIAYHVLSQSPDQLRQLQMGNQQTAAAQQIGALHQEIQGLKSTLQQWQSAQQFTYTRSAVDQFANSHPRFDEIGAAVEQELKLGFDLETAYRRAELLYPAAQVPQTHNTSAQTRQPDRSISGNPDVAPSNGASRRPQVPSASPRAALQNAMKRVTGA